MKLAMNKMTATLLFIVIMILNPTKTSALGWPVIFDSTQTVSGGYGPYIKKGTGTPYMHTGIDIEVAVGTPVYAIDSGYVKVITTLYDSYSSWRIVTSMTTDTGVSEGWMYAHLDPASIAVALGQWVNPGDLLATVVSWPGNPTWLKHVHLSRIRYHGPASTWGENFTDWDYIGNPLEWIDDIQDTDIPVLQNALGNQLLAFCQNESDTYFAEGQPISGDVDIICKTYDQHGFYRWTDVPYKIDYKIDGESSIPWTTATWFTGEMGDFLGGMVDYIDVVYQDDATCNTEDSAGLEGESHFYFNLTNSNGDGLVEASDKLLGWNTTTIHNGSYKVTVKSSDIAGNFAIDSMNIEVVNYSEISGNVTFSNGNPTLTGVTISTNPDTSGATTNASGDYIIPTVGGGEQLISFSRLGYETLDTLIMVTQDTVLVVELQLGAGCCVTPGDYDANSSFNIADVTSGIQRIFNSGPAPICQDAADANGDNSFNIADVTFGIARIFASGPTPICGTNGF